MMEIAIAVTTTARRFGYDVLLLTNDEGPEGIRRVAVSARADAMILMDVSMDDERIPMLRDISIARCSSACPPTPRAGLRRPGLRRSRGTVRRAPGRTGPPGGGVHRRGPRRVPAAQRVRRADAARVIGRGGGAGLRVVHRPCEGSHEAAAATITRILEDRPGTTGLVVQNEAVISPLLSVLRTAGRTVPEDMSVVAICPDQAAERTSPHLTSVAIPAQDMGRRAVEMLARRLDDGAASEVALLPPRLTVRGSTAPA